jgi:exosome complex component MTR3
MVAYMPSRKEITQLTLTGEWTDGKITNVCFYALTVILLLSSRSIEFRHKDSVYLYQQAVELCMDACSKLCDILRNHLKETANLASE